MNRDSKVHTSTEESGGQLLRQYLQVLKRQGPVIALVVALSSMTAFVVSKRMTPMYEGVSEINVQPFTGPSSQSASILNLLTDPTAALATDVATIQSPAVLDPAARQVGLGSSAALKSAVSAAVLPGTQIIGVHAKSRIPKQARDWANAVTNAFISFQRDQAVAQVAAASKDLTDRIAALKAAAVSGTAVDVSSQIDSLQSQLNSLPGLSSIVSGGGTVIAPATTPTVPVSPRKAQNVLLGAVVGLLLAVGLVLLIEALDDRLRGADEIEARTGVPNLGSVPFSKELTGPTDSPAIVHQRTGPVAEAYRTLRTNLMFLSVERPLRVLLVTSSVKSEGKSTTAANLAAAFAVSGVRTILVSADLRRPSLHRFFGLQNSVGLVDAVLPNVAVETLLQSNGLPDLRLLAAGRVPPNPTEILGSARFAELLRTLRGAADLVIVDSPPLLGVADASALASRVDGVLLVVNPTQANRRTLEHATDQLNKAGGRLLGTVLNAVSPAMGYGYGYGYGYEYSYSEDGKRDRKGKWESRAAATQTQHADGQQNGRGKQVVPSSSRGPGASESEEHPTSL